MSNYDLLSLEEIKKLSSIILEGYSNGSYIPISKFLELNDLETNENINSTNKEDQISEKSYTSFESENELDNSENISEDDAHNNSKDKEIRNTGLLSSLDEENDLFYNIQKTLNSLNLNILHNE